MDTDYGDDNDHDGNDDDNDSEDDEMTMAIIRKSKREMLFFRSLTAVCVSTRDETTGTRVVDALNDRNLRQNNSLIQDHLREYS